MIELSCDLGEASSAGHREIERAIWPLIDAVNVACGGHAGDEASMHESGHLAEEYGVALGAHPSYPDRENFGRRSMAMDPIELRQSLIDQIRSLHTIALVCGTTLQRVKAHGALYNDAHHDAALAEIIIAAAQSVDPDLAIVASETSQMAASARRHGMRVVREAFADRRYAPDGSLVPRSEPGALLSVDEAADQAWMLATERAVGGIPVVFDTLCIHADMEQSVERLRSIRQRLAPFVRITAE